MSSLSTGVAMVTICTSVVVVCSNLILVVGKIIWGSKLLRFYERLLDKHPDKFEDFLAATSGHTIFSGPPLIESEQSAPLVSLLRPKDQGATVGQDAATSSGDGPGAVAS
jgi:hypothetical protein